MSAERESSAEDAAGSPRRWAVFLTAANLYLAVIAGGIIGSLARWGVAVAMPPTEGGLPWATFFANVTGCFVIGFYAALTGPGGRLFVSARARQFVMTGICGGYTTFSGFSIETVRFLMGHDLWSAVSYIVLSVVGWLSAVWLGDVIAEWINN